MSKNGQKPNSFVFFYTNIFEFSAFFDTNTSCELSRALLLALIFIHQGKRSNIVEKSFQIGNILGNGLADRNEIDVAIIMDDVVP